MIFAANRVRAVLRRLIANWCAMVSPRSNDVVETGDLDQVWRAECEEMKAILDRKDPRRIVK